MDVKLIPEIEKFVEEAVKSGRYASADDMINGALLILHDQQALLDRDDAEFRAAVQHGLDQLNRGEVEDWDVEEIRVEGQRLLEESRKKTKRAS